MTPDVALITHEPAPIRELFAADRIVPVLIRVPALRPSTRRPARRRRRLRREVRLGGLAVLFGMPVIALGMMIPRLDRVEIPHLRVPVREAPARPPAVSLLPALLPAPAPISVEEDVRPRAADEHWVEAWSTDLEENLPAARTAGYLLPDLPVLEDGNGGRESADTGS